MTDDERDQRFLERMTPEQRQQWNDAVVKWAPKFMELLAKAETDEPCCRPENCPNSPEWTGNVIGWGGNPNEPHRCCICAT